MERRAGQNAALRALAVDLALLFAAKGAVGLYVLSAGFTHVSDDDYARVVIAQQFAHQPSLDPSGTSWLPFPFWLAGGAMLALGRSLAMARVLAGALGIVSLAAPYAAIRSVGCGRATALGAVGIALAIPWSAWLGVATVPEAPTACLIAAAAIAVTSPRARLPASLALLAASLSRYEAWPACAVFAAACAISLRAPTTQRTRTLAASAIAVAGPLAWMLWNARAHGSALHFVSRVAAYRQAIGAAAVPLSQKLEAFPIALASVSELVLLLSLAATPALALDRPLRRRWVPPLASAAAILAFLVYGDLRDGAPTHHPERAVLPIVWILIPFAADALRTLARRYTWGRTRREMCFLAVAIAGAVAWLALLPGRLRDAPGLSAAESREAQIARGLALEASSRAEARWTVTPCAYEHFALLAASSAPERFTILPATQSSVTASCPSVEVR